MFRSARGQGLLFLLETGLDPRATDTEGNTALHAAARLGDFRLVEKLSAYPVDPDIENDRGRTAREEMRVLYRGRASSLKRTDALFLRLQTGQESQ